MLVKCFSVVQPLLCNNIDDNANIHTKNIQKVGGVCLKVRSMPKTHKCIKLYQFCQKLCLTRMHISN